MLYMLRWSAGAGMGDNPKMFSYSSLWLLERLANKAENMPHLQKISDSLTKFIKRNRENR